MLALVADLTRDEVRTRAMAIVGVTIGFSFIIAIGVGPLLASAVGISGIFWLTAAFALVGIGITLAVVPTPPQIDRHRDAEAVPALFARVCRDRQLLRLDFAIFALHAMLTASFLAVPTLLARTLHLAVAADWQVYLPVMAVSIALMVPLVIVAERSLRMKEVFLATIVMLAASPLALAAGANSAAVVVVALVIFFAAFNTMEALLPSLVTKTAPAGAKGTATGIYSSSQFLGIFFGGTLGGWALASGGDPAVFGFVAGVAVLWLCIAVTMDQPQRYRSYVVRLAHGAAQRPESLSELMESAPGVVEALVAADEGRAYLKIDPSHFDPATVARIAGVPTTSVAPG